MMQRYAVDKRLDINQINHSLTYDASIIMHKKCMFVFPTKKYTIKKNQIIHKQKINHIYFMYENIIID
ncbi:hypothetical protein TA05_10185 [Citrobacter rodentium]|nr:hypothetical protein TA05_10185 [Citrobacter rodentium]